jgi:dynactin 6
LAEGDVLEDFEIVFGNGQRRREKPGLEEFRKSTHDKELKVLRRLIPSNLTKWQTTET